MFYRFGGECTKSLLRRQGKVLVFLIISPFVVPHEGLFSDSRGTFPYIFEILVKIREILRKISGIVRKIYRVVKAIFGIACKIYGVSKAISGIACKIERVLKEMRGVSMPISRIACKTREISTMIWVNSHPSHEHIHAVLIFWEHDGAFVGECGDDGEAV